MMRRRIGERYFSRSGDLPTDYVFDCRKEPMLLDATPSVNTWSLLWGIAGLAGTIVTGVRADFVEMSASDDRPRPIEPRVRSGTGARVRVRSCSSPFFAGKLRCAWAQASYYRRRRDHRRLSLHYQESQYRNASSFRDGSLFAVEMAKLRAGHISAMEIMDYLLTKARWPRDIRVPVCRA